MLKKIVLGLVVILVLAQFLRPERNLGAVDGPNFIGRQHPLPAATARLLERACYDCHSNHTDYPWYASVQPVAWWIAHHVDEGKRHLNFSEFGAYNAKRAHRKLEEVAGEIREDDMPILPYTLIHARARLTLDEKQQLIDWAEAAAKATPVP